MPSAKLRTSSQRKGRWPRRRLREAGGVEGGGDGGDQRAEIARQAQHVGRRQVVAAAAQQRRRDDGEIGGAHRRKAAADLGEIVEAEAGFDFGEGAEGEQQPVVAAAGIERGSPRILLVMTCSFPPPCPLGVRTLSLRTPSHLTVLRAPPPPAASRAGEAGLWVVRAMRR